MLTKIEIENFKSIYKETIELGRVNVFIGENGCGKTNILEAVGMASAAVSNKLSFDELALKGIRVTKPSITFSSFAGAKSKNEILLSPTFNQTSNGYSFHLNSDEKKQIFGEWHSLEGMVAKMSLEYSNLHPKIDDKEFNAHQEDMEYLSAFKIYQLETEHLRGIGTTTFTVPGIHGENLDLLVATFSKKEFAEFKRYAYYIAWMDEVKLDTENRLRMEGYRLHQSSSKLYFLDKFMAKKNNIVSSENVNDGILHLLFYIALVISNKTPRFFAIDNIETSLNPYLCRVLIEDLVKLAKKHNKQVLITTHHPAVLDGLNIHDEEQRLFVVSRNLKGHTKTERLRLKPHAEVGGERLKMSELWMRNYLGAQPQVIESL